jgi:hypothetical protein
MSEQPKLTARELLVDLLGDPHALHTVVLAARATGSIRLTCSCGATAWATATEANIAAVRTVPGIAS